MPDTDTWGTDDVGQADASGTAMIMSGYAPPITVAATPTYVGGTSTGYVTPAMVSTTSTVDSPIRPIIGSGIASIAGCSVTSEDIP